MPEDVIWGQHLYLPALLAVAHVKEPFLGLRYLIVDSRFHVHGEKIWRPAGADEGLSPGIASRPSRDCIPAWSLDIWSRMFGTIGAQVSHPRGRACSRTSAALRPPGRGVVIG